MTLRHAASFEREFGIPSVSSNDNFQSREWPEQLLSARKVRIAGFIETEVSQASCVTIGSKNAALSNEVSQASCETIGSQHAASSHESEPKGNMALKDMVEKRLSDAMQALASQHQQALSLIDEFCRCGVSPTGKIAEHGISLPGVVPVDAKIAKTDGRQSSPRRPSKSRNDPSQYLKKPGYGVNAPRPTGEWQEKASYPMQLSPVTTISDDAWAVSSYAALPLVMPTQSLKSHQDRVRRKATIAAAEQAQMIGEKMEACPSTPRPVSGGGGTTGTGTKNTAMFSDVAEMKERIKQSVMKPEYNVLDRYHNWGFWQSIAKSPAFEHVTLLVITLNTIWIAVDTDYNKAPSVFESDSVFIIGENFFCVYFCIEVVTRFMAFASKSDALRDAWFVFDSILVVMMVFELWIMNVFIALTSSGSGSGSGLGNTSIFRFARVLRLTRMARMARLLRVMPEVMILIKGIAAATRSVFFTLCLLAILIYVFGIAFTQLCQDTVLEDMYFKTVPNSMATLLLKGTLPDLADFVNNVGREHVLLAILMMFFILFSVLTVMNMLVGVLVEVVSVVSAVEREQMTVHFVRSELLSMLKNSGLDKDGDHQISRTEFESLLTNPSAARIIQEVGVDVVGLVDYCDFIFRGDEDLSFPKFMEAVLSLRGTNNATVKDMVDLRKFISNHLSDFADRMEEVAGQVDTVQRHISLRPENPMEHVCSNAFSRTNSEQVPEKWGEFEV